MSKVARIAKFATRGGGILVITITILSNLNAIELKEACKNNGGNCNIKNRYTKITNTGFFTGYNSGIDLQKGGDIDTFINYGEIDVKITFLQGDIKHLINYGTMKGISVSYNDPTNHIVTIDNRGVINPSESKYHFKDINICIANYAMILSESAENFNKFNGTNPANNSHLVLDSVKSVSFVDKNSKIILDFGNGFELGKGYALSKLAVDTSGNNKLQVDFNRLTTKSDIYYLTQSGEYFIARLQPQHSIISNTSKSNIRTMNNFYTISNSMIYPRKSYHSQNLGKKNQNNLVILREQSDRRISKSNIRDSSPKAQNDNIMLDSANPLKSYESFAYRNESINRRIQRQNKRSYNRRLPNQSKSQNLKENQRDSQNLDSANKTNQNNLRDSANPNNLSLRAKRSNHPQNQNNPQTQRFSQNLSQTPHNYYFILTPFINHNSFAQSGNYNIFGFDYGFLTAFSTKVAESNSLGTHFIFSYGSLGDSKDKDLSIKSLNLNVGLNYKLDLIYDMYLKARGDFYYFSNALDSATIKNIKPNNLGFGASLIFGKDFNFGKGGILGIEAGIDYKGLKTNEVSLNSQTYKQSLLNLIYADLGINYNKYFGGFGINLGGGFKANLAPKLAESALFVNTQNLRFTIDNDKYLAYANAGISYLLNTKNFDMEFSLAYYGNFGDRGMSNGGGVEFRVEF